MKSIALFAQDSTEIEANHYISDKDEVLIIAPGWCMTKDSFVFKQISEFFAQNFDVICFDFRGHGKSKGFYTFSAKEEQDLKAVIDYGKKYYSKINLMGFSLGGAVCAIYAGKNEDINKIILVSPPSDFNKIENKMWKKEAWGETFKKFELSRFLTIRPSIIPYKKEKPVDLIQNIKAKTLFLAGKLDPTVYYWHTENLYKKAECKKEFKLFENGIHAEDLFLNQKEEFCRICIEWLTKE